jgi:hypothetical protein
MNFDPYRQNELRHFECTAHYLIMNRSVGRHRIRFRNEERKQRETRETSVKYVSKRVRRAKLAIYF